MITWFLLFEDSLSHSYNIACSMFLYLVTKAFDGLNTHILGAVQHSSFLSLATSV